MSYLPSLGQLPILDQVIEIGKGVVGAVMGQTYSVYRLGPTVSNSIISETPVYVNYPAQIRKTTDKKAIENVTFELEVYNFTTNNLNLQLGDILVEKGYESNGGQYVFAQHRPMNENIFMRAERNANITRPNPAGGAASQQPSSGAIAAPGPMDVKKASELFLSLNNGIYSFQLATSINPQTGEPYEMASVPFGLQPQNRVRVDHKPDFPTQVPTVQFVGFLPYLPGIQIFENDIINSDSQDRYIVAQVFQSDDVGIEGYIMILRKISV